MSNDPRQPLLPVASQYEVDFVIPRIGVDIPLGIDPFLLFKSRDAEYRSLHRTLVDMFNAGIAYVRAGRLDQARQIFDFPEVPEIGLGYTRSSRRGSGVGAYLAGLIVDTLQRSAPLQARGIRHIEEMQLVSAGIGPDRVSDIVANVLKRFLINYTQRQCEIWRLPVKSGVPVHHVYDASSQRWEDSYENLPVSIADGLPILLVPRRFVRALPWINYDDFVQTEFRAYLAARREALRKNSKSDVVSVTQKDLGLVDRYVRVRERQAAEAQPALDYIDEDRCKEAEFLKERLRAISPGREQAAEYQRLTLEILNYLFNPELIDGQPEVRTVDGTERRDIVFTNDSDDSFWDYIRGTHDNILVMFETKNTTTLDLAHINQTATYLGDRIGRFGIIVTRKSPPVNILRKIFSIWNDSAPNRKVILTLSDDQLCELLDVRCLEKSPAKWMQKHYRAFRTAVQ